LWLIDVNNTGSNSISFNIGGFTLFIQNHNIDNSSSVKDFNWSIVITSIYMTKSFMKNDEVKNVVEHCLSPVIINRNYIQQVKEEFTMLSYFLHSFKPHNILEIGCKGGTFYMFNKFSTGKKVGVDIDDQYQFNMHLYMYNEDFVFIKANSHLEETYQKVKNTCDSYDFIFIDGDHTYDGVKRDFELYKSLLSPRGYIGFHDIDPNHVFRDGAGGQVYKFWQELDYGSKTEIICQRSNAHYCMGSEREHYGGIGLWQP